MTDDGHRYTFGWTKGKGCRHCGQDHWALHCPTKEDDDD